ncbi:glycosyltransferase 87 family protein [Rhodococcoides corynebacterioides]|uniref:Membrane protein n=1 Tax=Rhodococcoides corynebacterioides TaxID=53972 RepID=A0ABS2KXH3_9NOCA|nr:putative membrane protein [Rhodococcus corynebacterioides]MBP1114876.1 putative membrane protein [Rhodococcus sp. PvP016]
MTTGRATISGRAGVATAATVTAISVITMVLGYLNKARCAGAPFDETGRSLAFDRIKDSSVCYSDIQFLWLDRGIDQHLFPYLTGGISADGTLTGGTVEYPVLSGLLMWVGGLASHTDAQFLLYSALLLAPFGAVTAWMLGRLGGRVALLWSAGPALVLYAFHNWELPVVATAVGAVYVMSTRMPLRRRAYLASALLAVGFCLKLYPGAFVLPLALYVLAGGVGGAESPVSARRSPRRLDVRGAAGVIAVAAAVVAVVNLPFAILGYDGWRASFAFQGMRQADITTNSIWYWGLRILYDVPSATPDMSAANDQAYQSLVSVLSPLLVLVAFAAALWFGWRRRLAEGTYPWVQTSAVMLVAFLLFHKVHSPQYTLWLVPFFVLLHVPWHVVTAYLITDVVLGVGVFRYFAALSSGSDATTEENVVVFGVWVRAVLLVVLVVLFARSRRRTLDARPTRSPRRRTDAEAEVPV